jgi:hypothetical protein
MKLIDAGVKVGRVSQEDLEEMKRNCYHEIIEA